MESSTNNLTSNPGTLGALGDMGKNVTSIDNATAGAHQTIDKVSQAARPAVDVAAVLVKAGGAKAIKTP